MGRAIFRVIRWGPWLALALALSGSYGVRAQSVPARPPCTSASTHLPEPPPLGLDALVPTPQDNPLTPARVRLGARLFDDSILSRDRTMRCASCHRPDHAFSDTVPLSPGIHGTNLGRNAPTLLNRAYGKAFFWDGRASTLEEAVVQPIRNPRELDLPLDSLVARLGADASYRADFRSAFGERPDSADVGRALAAYVRTLRSGGSAVDRFVAGDTTALDEAARIGYRLFNGKANCSACHSGPNFSDEELHNTGVSLDSPDAGRARVSGDSADVGRFKTPTLRNVALTGPYMHDGSIPSLDSVVAFYDAGGHANPHLDREIHPLHLSAGERAGLVAFLRALTGGRGGCSPARAAPTSRLRSDGARGGRISPRPHPPPGVRPRRCPA